MSDTLSPSSNSDWHATNGDLPPGPTSPILDWEEAEIHAFFSSLGFPYYEAQVSSSVSYVKAWSKGSPQIEEHGLSGEILVHVDHEALKDIGIHSVVRIPVL